MTTPPPAPAPPGAGADPPGRLPPSFVRIGLVAGVLGYGGTAVVDLLVDRVEPDEPLAAACLAVALALWRRRPGVAGALGLAVVFAESMSGFRDDGILSGSGLVLPVLVAATGLFLGEVWAVRSAAASLAGVLAVTLPGRAAPLSPEEVQRAVVLAAALGIIAALTFAGVRSHRRALAASERERRRSLALLDERRSLEESLSHAQRLETVGLLAGGVAHDFNNLLTAIGGNAELLAAQGTTEARELAAEILDAQRRGSALTRQLLAFARRDVRRPERLDLAGAIRGMERLLARLLGERNRLELRAPGEVHVLADRTQLEQVAVNLLTNARDASPPGAAISVTVRAAAAEDARAAAGGRWEGPGAALLEVEDRGAGMSPETRARIFEPFFTTKPRGQGTGLGLSTVHGIVAQSGGVLAVDSVPGRGSVFRIYMPLAPATAASPGSGPSPGAVLGGGERVVVVEDDPGVRGLVVRALGGAGYDVAGYGGGEEALAALDVAPAPALLLTDVAMPGLEGPEVARRARARHPGLRVLFMTGYLGDAPAAQEELIRKPFTPHELLRRVREALAPGGETSSR